MTIPSIITVLQAHERGEVIEIREKGEDRWEASRAPKWNFHNFDYRIAPTPAPIPLTPADVPPGSVVRRNHHSEGAWSSVSAVMQAGVALSTLDFIKWNMCVTWPQLAADWQILRPGGVWEPAGKTLSP